MERQDGTGAESVDDLDELVVHWRGRELHVYGHGHQLVQLGNATYMAPRLLLHYVVAHRHHPPIEFVAAVLEGRFLTKEDLAPIVRVAPDRKTWSEWLEACLVEELEWVRKPCLSEMHELEKVQFGIVALRPAMCRALLIKAGR